MKFVILACVAALAAAEADADAYYGGFGYPYAYGYVPFGSSTGLDPITQGLDASTQGYAPYYHHGYYGHYLGKREAEADPALLYAGYAGYPYASVYGAFPHAVAATAAGYVHSSHVGLCTNYLGAAVPCRRKRSAEPHHGYGFHGLPHGLPLGYKSAPCVNAANH